VVDHPLKGVPFYDGDVEAAGLPDEVVALREAVDAADGVVFFSPEYNGSYPAVTKNAIDWLSRPTGEGPINRAAITMVSASPGPRQGAGVRDHFAAVMPRVSGRIFGETFGIGPYPPLLDEAGELSDQATIDGLSDFLARFATHVESSAP